MPTAKAPVRSLRHRHQDLPESAKGKVSCGSNRDFSVSAAPAVNAKALGQSLPNLARPAGTATRLSQRTHVAVHIPGGIETGMRLRLSNEGEHGVQGGPQGTCTSPLRSNPIRSFTAKARTSLRRSDELVTAILGGRVEVPTLKGNTFMKVPAGTQPDKVLRLKGLGIPSLKSRYYRRSTVLHQNQIPTKLTRRQKELLDGVRQGKRHDEWKPTATAFSTR